MFFKTLVTFFLSAFFLHASISITARWNPSTVQVGEIAIYELVINGVNAENFPLRQEFKNVNGLDYRGPMRSFNRSFINGEVSIQTTYQFNFQTSTESRYTFPSYSVKIGNQSYIVPAATLKVVANQITHPQTGTTSKLSDLIQLTVDKPSKIYIGQTFPLTVKLLTASSQKLGKLQFNVPPLITSDDFTAPVFGQVIDQVRIEKNDQLWDAYGVTTLLTALKEGDAPLAVEWDYLLQISDSRSNRRSLFDDFFSDSIFGSLNRRTLSKKATIPEFSLTVLPLPSDGKPQQFDGAIGEFTLESSLSSSEVNIGEPITLTLRIIGEGNFDRITPPTLKLDPKQWKTYPPTANYQDKDPESHLKGYRGAKTFEYIIIPLQTLVKQTPNLSFAYFSPQKEQYFLNNLTPASLKVVSNDETNPNNITPISAPTLSSTDPTEGMSPTPPSYQNNFFRPIAQNNTGSTASLTPWLRRKGFWIAQGFIASVFLGILYYQHKKKQWNRDPKVKRLRRARKSIQFFSKQANRAIEKKEYARFLEIARLQLSEAVAWEEAENTPSLTHKEIEKHLELKCDKLEKEALSTLMDILIAEEQIKYGQKEIPAAQWQDWQKTLLQSTKKLLL